MGIWILISGNMVEWGLGGFQQLAGSVDLGYFDRILGFSDSLLGLGGAWGAMEARKLPYSTGWGMEGFVDGFVGEKFPQK